jgi:hypothetical protein
MSVFIHPLIPQIIYDNYSINFQNIKPTRYYFVRLYQYTYHNAIQKLIADGMVICLTLEL